MNVEVICEQEGCGKPAKIRVIKNDLIRIHNKNSIGNNVDLQYKEIIKELFLCASCAMNTSYTIVEWIVDKIPHENLFGVDGLSLKYADAIGMKYWAMSHERDLRWNEQLHCPSCGHKFIHEDRYYPNNDGYDSPSRWIEVYAIVHCKNCGFFDSKRAGQLDYSRAKDNAGEYSDWGSPNYDPDYKQWKATLEDLKKKEEEDDE